MSIDPKPSQVKVAIIGAGVGGISTAIALKQKLGFTNFTIYEKASAVGGTWRDNTYPGCACDVPIHWYSLSTELNPNWDNYYADQPEILNYWQSLAMRHQLYPKIQFNTCIMRQTWDSDRQAWVLDLETNGNKETVTAELVVSAMGGLQVPAYAKLPGMETFQGPMFHSARWNYGVELHGKRVGVIGNGCSAAQFVPKISEDPTAQVINFCRTPNWFVPRLQFKYSAVAKWVFRNIPFTARMYRNFIATISDWAYVIWSQKNKRTRAWVERRMLHYMRQVAPKKYHEKLTPQYPMGCKRIIVDPGYYDCLHRPNVELEWGGVREIVKDGLITNDGKKHELDVIIYGTGFDCINPDLSVTGRGGQALLNYFETRGGPEAYYGTTVPGFPNLFTILGPNVASGHASAIFSEEQQILYALQLMRPVIEGKARSFEVRADISHGFNDELQRQLAQTTWASCRSYYRVGAENMGKIIATFPGSVFRFWYLTRSVQWSDYIGVGADKWERERSRKRAVKRVLALILAALAYLTIWKTGSLDILFARVLNLKAILGTKLGWI